MKLIKRINEGENYSSAFIGWKWFRHLFQGDRHWHLRIGIYLWYGFIKIAVDKRHKLEWELRFDRLW
jgi:hypothetical protein